MDLGEKIKLARLEAGLSQRQLCGETITRNMLSQIENGSARPSMQTLAVLAARLGKSISFFLEEDVVTSVNQQPMRRARAAWAAGDAAGVQQALSEYRGPDPVFDAEKVLLERLATLAQAEAALQKQQPRYAQELLENLEISGGYCAEALERQRLLLLGRAKPPLRREIVTRLPDLDEELLLRAGAALDQGEILRSGHLLDSAQNRESAQWNMLRGESYLACRQYREAADCYHRAEAIFPGKTAARLERCYRELGDFKQAYFYACKQR